MAGDFRGIKNVLNNVVKGSRVMNKLDWLEKGMESDL